MDYINPQKQPYENTLRSESEGDSALKPWHQKKQTRDTKRRLKPMRWLENIVWPPPFRSQVCTGWNGNSAVVSRQRAYLHTFSQNFRQLCMRIWETQLPVVPHDCVDVQFKSRTDFNLLPRSDFDVIGVKKRPEMWTRWISLRGRPPVQPGFHSHLRPPSAPLYGDLLCVKPSVKSLLLKMLDFSVVSKIRCSANPIGSFSPTNRR